MWVRNPALDVNPCPVAIGDADEALHMDQDEFRAFYEQTARPVWLFLLRRSGERNAADDLLQETYYRFLRTNREFESESHRRNYLFRIASNVAHENFRRRGRRMEEVLPDSDVMPGGGHDETAGLERTDLARAMGRLSARQRQALWLAYAEGSSHREIAEVLGLKTASVKLLLFRARRKLAALLSAGSMENES